MTTPTAADVAAALETLEGMLRAERRSPSIQDAFAALGRVSTQAGRIHAPLQVFSIGAWEERRYVDHDTGETIDPTADRLARNAGIKAALGGGE